MKKIIAVLTLLLAFTINASAQDKGSAKEKAKKQAVELTEYLSLKDEGLTQSLTRLFEQKYQILDDKNATAERKAEMSRVVEAKLRATFNDQQMQRIEKNPELLKQLVN